ncbi:hypothetical protein Pfo_018371 [Paulownia fortunei]|nr:hypothetical protein Pfo_018371 [Paulownia fortunei]
MLSLQFCFSSLLLPVYRISNALPPEAVTEDTLHKVAESLKMYVDELPQMPKLYGYELVGVLPKPTNLNVGMYRKKWKFHRDLPPTTVFAYGTSASSATVPGPTIEAIRGVPLIVTWHNHLPQSHILPWDPTIPTAIPRHGGIPTVVHLHGGVQAPESDGNALAWFTSGFQETGPKWSTPTYTYPNVQDGGNMWYHDHALGLTRVNLLSGLIGAYVLRDLSLEAKLNLPQGPEFDRHLMIFDRSFNKDGSLYMNRTGDNPTIHPQWKMEYFGNAIIVNGKAWPYLKVRRRKYRFRIINASNARFYRFILVAPAEVADVIIDFSSTKANECLLTNNAPYPFPSGDPVDHLNSKVMKFIIKQDHDSPIDNSKVPRKLTSYPVATIKGAVTKRYITLDENESPTGDPINFSINGKKFEDPVTETPKVGTTEVWEVINLTDENHPFHIHLATFQAIRVQEVVDFDAFMECMTAKNDAIACNVTAHATGKLLRIPSYEKTWKNVVKMVPRYITTIVVRFKLLDNNVSYPFDATAEPGYVYHCHMLDHEDNFMVRPLKLVD